MPDDPDGAGGPLDDYLCFALYAASRAMTAFYRPLLEPLHLTYPQYLVLLALWHDGTLSVGDLGQRLQLDSGTLSPLVRRLEGAGLVTRTRRADDERSVDVALSPAGHELRARAAHVPVAVGGALGMAPEDELRLRSDLQALAGRLRDAAHP